jgi:LuxR family maltose regulon positive regulatory protein
MKIPLIAAKFSPLLGNDRRINRQSLLDSVTAGIGEKVTLVSASAGYGKTSLVSDWVNNYSGAVAWLTITDTDNYRENFLTYLIHAFQYIEGSFGADILTALENDPDISWDIILPLILDQIKEYSEKLILVLDDYHLIEEVDIHDSVWFLITNSPKNFHVIIVTREDPPWPLGRLRAQGQVNEIRVAKLKFSLLETIEFLNSAMDLGLSRSEVERLQDRTEGWIVGLKLAAMSIEQVEERTVLLNEFSSNNRFIVDYLMEEVLYYQSIEIKDFLLDTSILETMNASLCDMVRDSNNSEDILRHLEGENLFVEAIDFERNWYRYHHLFSQCLQRFLHQEKQETENRLHARASKWYLEKGFIPEAIQHAVKGEQFDKALDLIEKNVVALLFDGNLRSLKKFLDSLPEEILVSSALLVVTKGWIIFNAGDSNLAEVQLSIGERQLHEAKLEKDKNKLVKGVIALVRSCMYLSQGSSCDAERCAREALTNFPHAYSRGYIQALTTLAASLTLGGKFTEAQDVLTEAIQLSKVKNDRTSTATALCELAFVEVRQGKLHSANASCQEALALVEESRSSYGRYPLFAGNVFANICYVLLEWGQLEQVIEYSHKAIEISESLRYADLSFTSQYYLALALQATGVYEKAIQILRELKLKVRNLSEYYTDIVTVAQVLISIEHGKLNSMTDEVEEIWRKIKDDYEIVNDHLHIGMIEVFLALADYERATRSVDNLIKATTKGGRVHALIKGLTFKALLLYEQGQQQQALEWIEDALARAEPENYLMSFVKRAPLINDLFKLCIRAGIQSDYVQKILTVIEHSEIPDPEINLPQEKLLIEPLSDREVEVLELISLGMTNAQIAEELFISISTVKSHVSHIISKLGGNNRTEAVVRAKQLGILG